MSQITIEKIGRRHYIRNSPFALKDQLRAAGCKWDPEQRAWWTSKADVAQKFAKAAAEQPKAAGLNQEVAGKATYKGRSYYLAARTIRGSTHWDDRCEAVTSRDGSKMLLAFVDGSKTFWTSRNEVQVTQTYRTARTIASLREFAQKARSSDSTGRRAGTCADCGTSSARLVECADSSGIVAGCCPRCAAMSPYERSFA